MLAAATIAARPRSIFTENYALLKLVEKGAADEH